MGYQRHTAEVNGFCDNIHALEMLVVVVNKLVGGGVLPSDNGTGMCYLLGHGFRPVWSEMGYAFCLINLKWSIHLPE